MPEKEESQFAGIVLEWVDPFEIGVFIDPLNLPPALMSCLVRLSTLSPDSTKVRLVITGDMVASVRSRIDDPDLAEEFDLERGSGFVAGKTMQMPDGSIHVLLHAGFFLESVEDDERAANVALVTRVLVHEAQHVAMHQNHQDFVVPEASDFRARNFLSSAAAIADEYRAELGVDLTLRTEEPAWNASEILDALDESLNAIVMDYQDHLSVQQLVFEVGTVLLIAWKAMGYVAALERLSTHGETVLEGSSGPEWSRLVAPRWAEFTGILNHFTSGTSIMTAAEIATLVNELADFLASWMIDFGFTWTGDNFQISGWFLDGLRPVKN